MGNYNFDLEVNRYNTNSLKYDIKRGRPDGIFPLWVADTDFKSPDFLINALIAKANHGIFGYSEPLDSYFVALKGWYKRQYGVSIDTSKVKLTNGVVFSICQLIRSVTKENDSIIINEPVYYPFKSSILANNRKVVINELLNIDNKYYIDFNDFEQKIIDNNVKAYILCNPHNPVGRAWSEEELIKLFDICKKHNVYVISDEIHGDFVFNGSFNTAYKYLKNNFSICSALTKTFNIPGLQIAHTYISDEEVLEKFNHELDVVGYSQLSIFGLVASETLFNEGDEYLKELKDYLWNNILFIKKYLEEKLPKLKLIVPEATYLVWIDFREYGLSVKELRNKIINECNLWLDDGIIFGKSGSGFQRINIALPRKRLEIALDNLYNVFR